MKILHIFARAIDKRLLILVMLLGVVCGQELRMLSVVVAVARAPVHVVQLRLRFRRLHLNYGPLARMVLRLLAVDQLRFLLQRFRVVRCHCSYLLVEDRSQLVALN